MAREVVAEHVDPIRLAREQRKRSAYVVVGEDLDDARPVVDELAAARVSQDDGPWPVIRVVARVGCVHADHGRVPARVHDVVAGGRRHWVGIQPQVSPCVLQRPVSPDAMVHHLVDEVSLRLEQVAAERGQARGLCDRQRVRHAHHLIADRGGLELLDPVEAVEALDGLKGAIEQEAHGGDILRRHLLHQWHARTGIARRYEAR